MRTWASGGPLLVAAVSLVFSLAAAGCGDSDDGAPAATAGPTSTAPSTSTTAASPTVTTADTDLGEVLVDGEGFTLYRFTADEAGVSNCVEECASVWVPVIPGAELVVGDDLEPTRFGTVTRPDGMVQLTVEGMPLYTFTGDAEAGETTGQGVAGAWFAVTPTGELVGPEGAGGTTTTAGATTTTT